MSALKEPVTGPKPSLEDINASIDCIEEQQRRLLDLSRSSYAIGLKDLSTNLFEISNKLHDSLVDMQKGLDWVLADGPCSDASNWFELKNPDGIASDFYKIPSGERCSLSKIARRNTLTGFSSEEADF